MAKSGDLGVEWIFLDFRVKNKPCLVLTWGFCGLKTSKLGSTPQRWAQREMEGLSFTAVCSRFSTNLGLQPDYLGCRDLVTGLGHTEIKD